MHERGVSQFSVEKFVSQYRNFCRGTLLCSRNFWYRKTLGIRGTGGVREYDDFPSKIRFPKVPKKFVGEHFCVSEKIRYRKILWIRGGVGRGREFHDFPLEICCLTVPKKFVWEPFDVSENFGYRKILCIRGGGVSRFSVDFFLSHSTEAFRRRNLLCCVSEDFR